MQLMDGAAMMRSLLPWNDSSHLHTWPTGMTLLMHSMNNGQTPLSLRKTWTEYFKENWFNVLWLAHTVMSSMKHSHYTNLPTPTQLSSTPIPMDSSPLFTKLPVPHGRD
jgi:hypothetical protein